MSPPPARAVAAAQPAQAQWSDHIVTVTPISDEHPACLGVMCPEHGQCRRYHLVERVGSWNAIGTCHTDGDEYPLFLPVVTKEAA